MSCAIGCGDRGKECGQHNVMPTVSMEVLCEHLVLVFKDLGARLPSVLGGLESVPADLELEARGVVIEELPVKDLLDFIHGQVMDSRDAECLGDIQERVSKHL